MSEYLSRLKALKFGKTPPSGTLKTLKSLDDPLFEGFEGGQPGGFLEISEGGESPSKPSRAEGPDKAWAPFEGFEGAVPGDFPEKFPASIPAWRESIDAWQPGKDPGMAALKTKALAFLDTAWAAKAVSTNWDSLQLFGLYPAAPRSRYGAQGLVTHLAWTVLRSELVALDAEYAAFCTKSGALLRKPWALPEAEISQPFWTIEEAAHDTCG